MFSSNICHCNYYVSLIRLKVKSEVAQLCPTLCDPMDCSPPGSSIHGIFQERVLEWGAISFSRGSSQPRDWTQVSRTAGRRFTVWATREALDLNYLFRNTEVLGAFQWLWGGESLYADYTNLKQYEDYGYYCQSPLECFLLPSDETPPLLVMRVNSGCLLS